jgi:uncharacterized protein YecE (DUF72 family)
MADYWVGTSGYNYQEWKGAFTRRSARQADARLLRPAFHERRDQLHVLPHATNRILANWSAEVPEHFRFTLKAPRGSRTISACGSVEDTLASFCSIAKTLGPKLGPLLFQLPPYMKKDVELLEVFLHELPPGLQPVVEFRHASWLSDDTYEVLKRFGVALCIADSEERTTPLEVTTSFGYLRLRRTDYDEAGVATG